MSLLSSLTVELLEEILENSRKQLEIYELFNRHEEIIKTLLLMEYVKIELKVRELQEELKRC